MHPSRDTLACVPTCCLSMKNASSLLSLGMKPIGGGDHHQSADLCAYAKDT